MKSRKTRIFRIMAFVCTIACALGAIVATAVNNQLLGILVPCLFQCIIIVTLLMTSGQSKKRQKLKRLVTVD